MPIKFRLGIILEAIFEVEERVYIEYIGDVNHKSSEVVDVVADATRLLEPTEARSRFLLPVGWGKMLA